MLYILYMDILTSYALKGPLLVNNYLGLFSILPQGTLKPQFNKFIRDCQNQVLDEYDDEATRDILGCKKSSISSRIKKSAKMEKKKMTLFLRQEINPV